MAASTRTVRLGEVVDMVTGFPFRSTHYVEDPAAIRLVRGDNIVQGALRWDGVKRWPRASMAGLEKYELAYGDVVLAMDRPWIEAGLKYAAVGENDLPALLVQRVARLRGVGDLDRGYLRYVIGSAAFTSHVLASVTGTAVPHISGPQIASYEFDLPPLPEQRRIAHVLGTLDDKIELNRRMNKTLEEMASALFKSWFVDFEPVRAKAVGRDPGIPAHLADLFPDRLVECELEQIPEGWRMTELSSLAAVASGGTPKTSVGEYWDGAIPWFSVVDAPAISDVWVTDTARHVTQAGVNSSAAEIVPAGSTILSARGTVGKVALAGTPMAFNQSCYGFVPHPQAAGYHTYFAVRTLVATLKRRAHGSVFDTITRVTLAGISVPRPPAGLIRAYESAIGDVMQRIRTNRLESAVLQSVRDSLLPGLVAGTIRAKGRGAVPEP